MARRGALTVGILTGGGDVPGLNPAIRAITIRAIHEGYTVVGIRRGWAGLMELVREPDADNQNCVQSLSEVIVNRAGRTGGTFLHTSRTNPATSPRSAVPVRLRDRYREDVNDLTEEVLKNIEYLGLDAIIPVGGDDTLSYAHRLHTEGVNVIAVPKTMDNDVPGTDYCIGFSTCVTRTVELTHRLRTTAGSHERFLVLEVFGRYAGYTALLPAMAGAADRCVIPEHPFSVERLAELLSADRRRNESSYSVALVSEGARMDDDPSMRFEDAPPDQYGHRKLGGVGDAVAARLKEVSPQFNDGETVEVVNQRLGYLVRCGDPDAVDAIVGMAFGNMALDLVRRGEAGRLVALRNGRYDSVPLDVIADEKKSIDVERYYDVERLRPKYHTLAGQPLFIMAAE